MSNQSPDQIGPREVLDAIDRTPYGEILRDTARRRQLVFEAMAQSGDPLTREIGEQLRSGAIRPRDLLQVAEYRNHVAHGLEEAAKLDPSDLLKSINALNAEEKLTGNIEKDLSSSTGRPYDRSDATQRRTRTETDDVWVERRP